MKRSLLSSILLAACVEQPATPDVSRNDAEVVGCPEVSTSWPVQQGDVLTGDLRDFVVDNGRVRLRYGSHAMDFRDTGVTHENTERHADHVLAGRHTDHPSVAEQGCQGACHSGTHWHDAGYTWYGDGITFSSGNILGDADRVRVLKRTADTIELSYEWDQVRLDGLRSAGYCVLGRYPECGPTDRDSEGMAVWKDRSIDQVKSVKSVRLWKTVRMDRCTPGYYVSLRSDPPLKFPEQGSRAVRLGYVTSRVAWNCSGTEVARHPEAGAHVSLGTTDCIADIQDPMIGTHNGWPFVRMLKTFRPWPMSSLQYSPTQLGSPGLSEVWDTLGPDGRPVPWQAFVGALEYEATDLAAEPTQAARDLVDSVTVTW